MSGAPRFAFRGQEILVWDSACGVVGGAAAPAAAGAAAPGMPSLPSTPGAPRASGAPVPGLTADDLDSAGAALAAPGIATGGIERLTVPGGGQSAELYPAAADAPTGWAWIPFRSVVTTLPESEWRPAAKAMSLVHWKASTRFCGRCGSPNGDKPDELARLCPACGALSFPRISPAVLAAVVKDGKLLLARNVMHKTGIWSLLAGFVEPGETIEGCARREVLEEVGVEVEASGYLGSQPWPFPDQLMFGVTADWKSGELRPDGVEIAEAGWFGPGDALPPLPMRGSLSRRIIDAVFARLSAAGTPGRSA